MADWDAARDRATEYNGGWRAGVLHAAARLDRLARAHLGTSWTGAYEAAAAALREELKIGETTEGSA